MLVIAWEAMYDAIPRLQADESLSLYTVLVAASPAQTRDSLEAKQCIVRAWQQLANGPLRRARRVAEVSFGALDRALRGVFGEQIRE